MSARGGGRGGGGGARGGRGGVWIPAKRPRAAAAAPPSALGDPDAGALLLIPLSASKGKPVRAKVLTFSAAATGGKEAGALLDIREMWPKEGLPYPLPSKRGICLSLPQAEALFARGEEILGAMRAARPAGAAAGAAAAAGGEEGDAAPAEAEGGEDEAEAARAAAKKEKKRRKLEAAAAASS